VSPRRLIDLAHSQLHALARVERRSTQRPTWGYCLSRRRSLRTTVLRPTGGRRLCAGLRPERSLDRMSARRPARRLAPRHPGFGNLGAQDAARGRSPAGATANAFVVASLSASTGGEHARIATSSPSRPSRQPPPLQLPTGHIAFSTAPTGWARPDAADSACRPSPVGGIYMPATPTDRIGEPKRSAGLRSSRLPIPLLRLAIQAHRSSRSRRCISFPAVAFGGRR
jgi:hypothetical protein